MFSRQTSDHGVSVHLQTLAVCFFSATLDQICHATPKAMPEACCFHTVHEQDVYLCMVHVTD